jgi:hypothetical protein
MRNILEIYEQYKIMPNLALHQLRVASVVKMILENLENTIILDKNKIITAALLHDMGNIIKFKLEVFPEFVKPLGLEYWQNIQNEYFAKYGYNEHKATSIIAKEIGVSEEIIKLLEEFGDHGEFCNQALESDEFEKKIVNYADVRVGPYGILSYHERMSDVKRRYANTKFLDTKESFETLFDCGREIENQIFANCKIKPEDINDEAIAPILEELKGFMVK